MPKDIIDLPLQGRMASVRAGSVDEAARTVEIIWTTGATVRRARFWDEAVDEELSLDPGMIRLERLNAGAPFLNAHDAGSLASVLGVVVDGSARIANGQGTATIRFSERADVEPIFRDIAGGIIRNVSVGYTIIKDYVRERERRGQEMFVPLAHPPGQAQADFGEAIVVIGGVEQKAYFFVMDLPHSDACFVRAYPAATAEAWMDGHVHAFTFFGGVPQSVLYDNDRCLVSKILPDGTRKRASLFSALQSHYLLWDRYGRPGKGNDKGSVEGIVGFTRRNYMVPIPRFANWEEFNADLEAQCRKRQNDILRGHKETIGERLERDLAAMRPLPGAAFEACDQANGKVSSQSLVRYDTNDYSVPVAYGHQDVWVRGYVDQVVIGCRGEVIAKHPRCYAREDAVFDPVHYLPLIERKINALDQAAPLAEWDLPEDFHTLRRLMEARMLKMGRREYVQVLRLLETFGLNDLHGAIKDALRLRAVGFDVVKHLLLCRIERRPPKLDLTSYPYLPRANVEATSAASYMALMTEAAE